MIAVIELGGKQYLVKEKDLLRVEKISTDDAKVTHCKKVLLTCDGQTTQVGAPYVKGASVELKLLQTGLSDKVIIFKMKAKKRYKRLRGHRQPFTDVEVSKITA